MESTGLMSTKTFRSRVYLSNVRVVRRDVLDGPGSILEHIPFLRNRDVLQITRWRMALSANRCPLRRATQLASFLAQRGRAMRMLNVHGFASRPATSRASVTASFSAFGARR